MLVAITVVLTAVLYVLISGLTKAPGTTPIGSAFTIGTVNEASSGNGAAQRWYYNASVQSGGGGIVWGNMIFQVQSPSGSVIPIGPSSVTTTNAASTCNVATYTFATALWTVPATNPCPPGAVGPSGMVVSGAALQLVSSASLQQGGTQLVAFGQGSFSGSASFSIP
jgi:hypothetical protein